jgi:peptidoglycan/LPS O-acetylase OafA/YrhL
LRVRRLAATIFLDHRRLCETALAVVLTAVFVAISLTATDYPDTLAQGIRTALYPALAGSAAALLGFVLTGLAILVALPSTERIEALRRHPQWELVPSSYFRAARALLSALVLSLLGVALDSSMKPWLPYEAVLVAILALSLSRVTASVVALDQIMAAARAPAQRNRIDDPGP